MANTVNPTPFTPDQVESWRRWDADLDSQIADLMKQKSAVGKLLEAAELMGVAPHSEAEESPEDTPEDESLEDGQLTWTRATQLALSGAARGVTPGELKTRVAELFPEFALRLKQSDKGFYGAVNKLYLRSAIIKHLGLLYTPENMTRLQREGAQVGGDAMSADRRSDFQNAIIAYLAQRDEGSTSAEIAQHLRQTPEFDKRMNNNPTYIYNSLSALTRRGALSKRGGVFRSVGISPKKAAFLDQQQNGSAR